MGMSKGSGTRSGLLWEVERLLNEVEELPQVLLMENVPQVHGEKNISDFEDWIHFLESKGYTNYAQDLNAKDYGIPQSRERCFMVSILGDYYYRFPEPMKLEKQFKDLLEDSVEDRYYITNEKAKTLIDTLILEGKILTDRQTDRQESTSVLNTQNLSKSQTQLRQDTIQDSSTTSTITPVLLKSQASKFEGFTNIANTLMARDYKGFGNETMNGVMECITLPQQ